MEHPSRCLRVEPKDTSIGTLENSNDILEPSADSENTAESTLLRTKEARPFTLDAERKSIVTNLLDTHGLETCSSAATIGSSATQLGASAMQSNHLMLLGQDNTLSGRSAESSYYIVEDGSKPRAFYLHKPQEALRKGDYEIEIMRADYSTAKEGKPTLSVPLAQKHLSNLPGSMANSRRSSGHHLVSSLNKVFVEKVREQIEPRRLENHQLHVVDESGRHAPEYKKKYLIDDDDLQTLVDSIKFEMRQLDGPRLNSIAREQGRPPRPSLPCLDGASIAPLPVTAVEPATTISQPTTSYTTVNPEDMKVHTRVRSTDTATTSTFLTRKSVAEVTWDFRPSPNKHSSTPLTSTTSATFTERHVSQSSSSAVLQLHHYEALAALIDLVKDLRLESSSESLKRSQEDIISFPQLLTRHCTNEWLTPPVENTQLVAPPPTDDMYLQGVDAHSGTKRPSFAEPEEPLKPFHCYSEIFDNPFADEALPTRPELLDRRASVASTDPGREVYSGQSIGSASHRRRSSQPHINNRPNESMIPALMERLRKHGHKVFHRNRPHHKSSDQNSGQAPTPHNSDMGHQNSGVQSPSRTLKVIHVGLTPPGSEDVSSPDIEENSPRRRLSVGQRIRKDTCSEDNRPHVCMVDGGGSVAETIQE